MNQDTTAAPGRKGKRARRAKILDDIELTSVVCQLFCKGLKPAAIATEINGKEEFRGLDMTREEPYDILQKAGQMGWLQFHPPPHTRYRERLRNRYPGLGIQVVHTATVKEVTLAAARELLQLIRAPHGKAELHIGFAGGHSMRELAKALARLLCEPYSDLPETIWFHALATGFDPDDPTTNPNTFFSYFLNEALINVQLRFHGLSAPSMIRPGAIDELKQLDEISEAFEAVQLLDIIATSGSSWKDPDSTLLKRMRKSKASMKVLDQENCVGDILWRPIGPSKPIEARTDIRALTLIDLQELPAFIKAGKRVLLMLAPCGKCNAPKGELLATVLNQSPPLITDLVVDSRSVGQILGRDLSATG